MEACKATQNKIIINGLPCKWKDPRVALTFLTQYA